MYWSEINTISPRKIPVRRLDGVAMSGGKSAVRPEAPPGPVKQTFPEDVEPTPAETNWQETALRLRAEMDNFRKRQERRTADAVTTERERLLALFLPVIDNLGRALSHQDQTAEAIRQGVELTYRELLRQLEAEGVARLETTGQPFDPNWHEAIAVVPAEVESGTIVEEIAAGYKLGDKLLRPAQVVVAA